MATTKKVVIQHNNGTDFDIIHPQTTAEQVIETANKKFVSTQQTDEWDAKVDHSSLGTAASKNTGIASGNVPILDAQGKLNESVLPSIAITDTFVVDSEVEMLALTVQTGDVAVRNDLSQTFILRGTDPTILGHWEHLKSPTDAVQSVNGKTGAVTLTKDDVGLSKAENKTVAEILTDAILTGTPKAPTPLNTSNDNSVATTKFVKDAIADLQPGENVVTSVNNRTGAVTLTQTDVGLDKVENKTVAEILTSPALTGTATAPTPSAESNDTTIATTAFVKNQTANLSRTEVSAVQPTGMKKGDVWYQEI